MSHMPINHQLRSLYRVLARLAGTYVVVFGVIGLSVTTGEGLFDQSEASALGLRTNLAFSIASVVAGVVILLAVLVGRNVDYVVNLWGGVGYMAAGIAMLALMNTDLNKLNASMSTVIVSFVIGMVLFAAGLYGRSGSPSAR